LVDRSIVRSRAGVRAVALSLGILAAAALAQALTLTASGSVALLADLIHNVGDALTAIPLGIAFLLRSYRGEKLAGLAVVAVIFFSACVAFYESIQRLLHPQTLTHLWVLAAAGLIGFIGNEIAAQVRLRAGKRLHSPAMIADGNHARVDGFVSLAVVASAALVAGGVPRASDRPRHGGRDPQDHVGLLARRLGHGARRHLRGLAVGHSAPAMRAWLAHRHRRRYPRPRRAAPKRVA
jgi:divalent metal cation (Fe/Co/Zn/Cd) transporter